MPCCKSKAHILSLLVLTSKAFTFLSKLLIDKMIQISCKSNKKQSVVQETT